VQFELDDDPNKAVVDREPTRVRAVMLAELTEADWSWQPAGPGKIRSGTATIIASGRAKLRAGAVWVDPLYRPTHDKLQTRAIKDAKKPPKPRRSRKAVS